jgi:hypothetical protein
MLGKIYYKENEFDSAYLHFKKALNNDGLITRCNDDFKNIMYDIINKYNLEYIDIEKELLNQNKTNLIGYNYFVDAMHPNLKTNGIIIKNIIKKINDMNLIKYPTNFNINLEKYFYSIDKNFKLKSYKLSELALRLYLRFSYFNKEQSERILYYHNYILKHEKNLKELKLYKFHYKNNLNYLN